MEFGNRFIYQWMQGIFGRTWERPDDGWLGLGNIDVARDRREWEWIVGEILWFGMVKK